jgi:hypothetical protein
MDANTTTTPAAEPQGAGTQTAREPAKQPDEKTFTQAELDKIIADRLARQKADFDKKSTAANLDVYNFQA